MTPAARIQAVIDILGELERTNQPVDRHLRDWFRARRFAGSKDRAAIGERVYAIQRHRAWLAWRMGSDAPRALVIASLLDEGDIEPLFTGGGYGPAALTRCRARGHRCAAIRRTAAACARRVSANSSKANCSAPLAMRCLTRWLRCKSRAPVDLRVNTLKATRDDVLAALRGEGYDANQRRTRRSASASRPARRSLAAARCSNAAPSNFRTRRRRSPRCSAARSRGCACSISRRARAASRSRWRRPCRTRARSSPATSADALRRTRAPRRARRRHNHPHRDRIGRATSMSFWSMRRAAAPAPGGASRNCAGG